VIGISGACVQPVKARNTAKIRVSITVTNFGGASTLQKAAGMELVGPSYVEEQGG
jgi:hypothetical protein